ncbi:hypothetical protein ACPUYX_11360 [Desulfosporosinus sp. SYSU MS00001]|uniref:hypothetical protein n=1 Tax=Desulfosporosinus sp. SYSU MS00001 TaxID=3416284 RepID=UPI003CEAFBB0
MIDFDSNYFEEFLNDFLINAEIFQNLLVNSVPLGVILNLRTTQIQCINGVYRIVNNDDIYELNYLDFDVRELLMYILNSYSDRPLFDNRFIIRLMSLAYPSSNSLVTKSINTSL